MLKNNKININKYNKKYTEPFGSIENNGENNLILTDKISLSLNSEKTKINANVLLVGAIGSGKQFCFSQPNILQGNCNFIITDPCGHLLETTGDFLRREGYNIKVLNLLNMKESNKYNPLKYIETEEDISALTSAIIKANEGHLQICNSNIDPFSLSTILLESLITYMILHSPKPEPTISDILELLQQCEPIGSGVNFVSKLDFIFDELREKEPDSPALVKFNEFKPQTIEEYKTVLICTCVCLTYFNIPEVKNIISDDEFYLKEIDNEKTAIFIILPPADTTFNFIASIFISQIIKELYRTAMKSQNKKIKHHTRFIFHEFDLLHQLYNFPKRLKNMVKYNMSCSIIIDKIHHLKDVYKNDWEDIPKHCDTLIFFGGIDVSTMDYFAREMEAFRHKTEKARQLAMCRVSGRYYRGHFPEFHFNDILNVDINKCLLIIRNVAMIEEEKFSCINHKNFKYLKIIKKEKEK